MSEGGNIVSLVEETYHSIPATLRRIAAAIEAGEYGEVTELALVHKNTLNCIDVHCAGKKATPARAHLLPCKGARILEQQW